MTVSDDFIRRLTKAELHLHIEGSFEPELMFEIARRSGVDLPYATVDDLKALYDFADLQASLDLYYAGMSVLLHEQDFYDLTAAYMKRAVADGVVHTEIFFDPQGHTERGVAFEVALDGIWRAMTVSGLLPMPARKALWNMSATRSICCMSTGSITAMRR